ncbi:MAG: hypothetical protein HQ546_02125, partial [Planctomycetes bacterium]|nr:hypothetical protein [Planctomycetota bacterium]
MRTYEIRKCGRFCAAAAVLLAVLIWAPTAHAVTATGGDITTNYTYESVSYRAHIFTNVVTTGLVVTGDRDVEVLIVAGGGGGGNAIAGGGGAGGLIYSSSVAVVSGSNYTVTVGAGGGG